MSVQAGIWNFDGKPVDRHFVESFGNSLKRQGPDGESTYIDGSIALLYRPFHTTAESRRETQPDTLRRGFALTWDGRLDNRQDLIAEIQGDLDAECTDVEIVAAAFEKWEGDAFRRIIGDWALSIWRPQERELIFAIDYMAIRHIFYYLTETTIRWSTELAPLVLLGGGKFQLDDEYISGYFARDPDAHLTPYREIRQVPAGHFLRISRGHGIAERYWHFSAKSRIRYKCDREYEAHFLHLFRQSVRRRLRSESPVLAELSGGLDSSSIVCMADGILAEDGGLATRLDTLSYYDKAEPHGDDLIYIRKVEDHRGSPGYHIDASVIATGSGSIEPEEFNALPGYLGLERSLAAQRAEVVRQGGYRIVLSGLGGDEFFGGIPDPSAQLADLLLQLKAIELGRQLLRWSLVKRQPYTRLLARTVAQLLPSFIAQRLVSEGRPEDWIDDKFARRTRLRAKLIDVREHFSLWLPTRRSMIGGVLMMANKLAKLQSPAPQMEEARYPYLDQNLIEFVLSIPATQLFRPGERRSLMRRSLDGIVPVEILSRKTKQFAARTPLAALENHYDRLVEVFTRSLSARLGYLDQSHFIRTLRAVKIGIPVHLLHLMRAISFEFWLRDAASRELIAILPAVHQECTPSSWEMRQNARIKSFIDSASEW